MAVERYLSRCIPDLRVGNNIGKIGKCPIHSIYVRDFCTDVRHVIKNLAPYVMHVFNIVTRMVITANTDIFVKILKFRERGFYLRETKFRENKPSFISRKEILLRRSLMWVNHSPSTSLDFSNIANMSFKV